MDNRISQVFDPENSQKGKALIAYICAGDPTYAQSLEIARTLVEAGINLLELGVPFSDPLADGLTNQLAAQRALEAGAKADDTLRLVSEIRAFCDIPIVLYTYYNLVFNPGVETYVRQAKKAGVDGLLALDCPPEEASDLVEASQAAGLCNIFIVAPTTPEERLPKIIDKASGFIYYVSRTGVTGVRDKLVEGLEDKVNLIKKHSHLPVAVGFGISSGDHVREVCQCADGAIVGSAIVNRIAQHKDDLPKLKTELTLLIQNLKKGIG